jgi:hypothetical protein
MSSSTVIPLTAAIVGRENESIEKRCKKNCSGIGSNNDRRRVGVVRKVLRDFDFSLMPPLKCQAGIINGDLSPTFKFACLQFCQRRFSQCPVFGACLWKTRRTVSNIHQSGNILFVLDPDTFVSVCEKTFSLQIHPYYLR